MVVVEEEEEAWLTKYVEWNVFELCIIRSAYLVRERDSLEGEEGQLY